MKIKIFFVLLSVLVTLGFFLTKGEAHNHEIAGDIISANCECGYHTTLTLGGGFSDYQTNCKFPFYCNGCASIVVLNALNEKHSCSNCKSVYVMSYDDATMRANKSNNSIFGWNVNEKSFKLTDDYYFCPKCQELKLKFTQVGNWD
jgi:hypothetical protein